MESNLGFYLLSHNLEFGLLLALVSVGGTLATIKALSSVGSFLNTPSHGLQASAAGIR